MPLMSVVATRVPCKAPDEARDGDAGQRQVIGRSDAAAERAVLLPLRGSSGSTEHDDCRGEEPNVGPHDKRTPHTFKLRKLRQG